MAQILGAQVLRSDLADGESASSLNTAETIDSLIEAQVDVKRSEHEQPATAHYVQSSRGVKVHLIRNVSRTWCRWHYRLARDITLMSEAPLAAAVCGKCSARAVNGESSATVTDASA